MLMLRLSPPGRALSHATISAGHDAKSLLFSLLDEFLFLFHSEGLVVKKATINGTIDRADSSGGGGGDSRGGDGSGGDGSNPPPRWRVRATA